MPAPDWLADTRVALRPPEDLSLSQWADGNWILSPETAAQPGRWRTLSWQREIMDAISDDTVERVVVMKSARVGYTSMISTAIGYHMAHDATTILCVQPTVEDSKGFSKEVIAPMLRDVPALSKLTISAEESATLVHKTFPGGILSLVGANSGTGFRRVSRRIILLDEVDAYPASAGNDGDPVALAERRSEHFWDRCIVAGSTPLVSGASRIEELFLGGDQRRFFVACPHCQHMDYLVFDRKRDIGHVMRWDEGKPEAAHFECRKCGCVIEEKHKRKMIESGEWRATNPDAPYRSYHIWTAYSLSPNASWGQIAAEFLEAKKRPETLRTFVNVVLGETWKERGEAPEWERLYDRRESYAIGTVPNGVIVLTAGVDVQKDRFVYEVVGWAPNKESWSIDAGEIMGETSDDATWLKLDELLTRTYPGVGDTRWQIAKLAIDSGYNTQKVYNWTRGKPNAMACKGAAGMRPIVGASSAVDVTANGKKRSRGARVLTIGVDVVKGELYGMLGLRIVDGVTPDGYCHFPEHDEEFFRQITAEHLVTIVNRKTNRARREWQRLPNRENHWLDCRVYARAAAAVLQIDRMQPMAVSVTPAPAQPVELAVSAESRKSSWLGGRRGWLR